MLALALLVSVLAQPPADPAPATVQVVSSQAGTEVLPRSTISWSILVGDISAATYGLAGISIDLAQNGFNPATIDIPAATGVPSALHDFSRPWGISNPQPGDPYSSAFTGTQMGSTGAKNLVQIGGMQNTFGAAGTLIGTDTDVETGIGQDTEPQLIAEGQFQAPSAAGSYCFELRNVVVNVLASSEAVNGVWPVARATPSDSSILSFCFTVPECCLADFNCSGGTPDDTDISLFFAAWNAGDTRADVNESGGTPDDTDVSVFFAHWNEGC